MSNSLISKDSQLEPRVAKLEEGLGRLTEDVRSLATIVRDQGNNVERQLNDLTIAVTQAAGPRKIDWSVIISAVLLVMAIGSAVFWPLNQTVQRLEEQIKTHVVDNQDQFESLKKSLKEDDKLYSTHTSEEFELTKKIYELQFKSMRDDMNLYNDVLLQKINKLENQSKLDLEREKDELQMWRFRAMGLSLVVNSKNAFVEQPTNSCVK
jgi:predicted PurR-regulated permease PerM